MQLTLPDRRLEYRVAEMCTRSSEPRPRQDVTASETLAEAPETPRESRELQRLAETFSVTYGETH